MNRRPTNSRERGGIISKLIFLCAFVALLAVLYLLRAPILHAAGEFWVLDDGLEHADAIIILSDDNYFASRASRAAEIFHGGWAPKIVASGRMLRPYAGIAELMERDLTDRGVPHDAVIRLTHTADNTLEEARALLSLVTSHGWHRILVVTSNHHTRRARYIFSRVFPSSIQVRLIPAADPAYDPANWWHMRSGLKLFLYESAGDVYAHWELRNADPDHAPAPEHAPAHP
jgi:uncharacterized SAM-binding protein YcdF (DUF218 family)